MPTDLSFLNVTVLGVTLGQLGLAFLIIFGGFALSRIAVKVLDRVLTPEGATPGVRRAILEAAEKPLVWGFIVGALTLALAILPLPEKPVDIRHFVDSLLTGGSVALAVWFATNLVDGLCGLWAAHAETTASPFDNQLVPIMRKSGKVFLITAGGVMVVQNLGYSVSSLLAGLGLGGAALALASKDTIANVFGSIVIFLDQPFYVGDWIEIGEQEGVVEEVGMRVTRIRTFSNSVITIPNAQLTTLMINNWSRMRKRRIRLMLGLTYDTKPAQMVQAVEAIRQVLREDERICQDFFLVNFTDLNAYSLDIMVYCFTATTDWKEHLQIRQEVLLKFMEAVEALGLSFAFPTQTLQVTSLEQSIPASAPMAMNRQLPS